MYRGWTQRDYQNKHYNINQKDEGTVDDRGRDGGTNFILRIKEQETLQEHEDDEVTNLFLLIFPNLKAKRLVDYVLNGWIHNKLVYRQTNLMHNLLLVYFVSLYMLPAI